MLGANDCSVEVMRMLSVGDGAAFWRIDSHEESRQRLESGVQAWRMFAISRMSQTVTCSRVGYYYNVVAVGPEKEGKHRRRGCVLGVGLERGKRK